MNSKVIVLLVLVILFAGTVNSHQSFAQPKYDGSKTYLTIWFDHAFDTQKMALDKMAKLGFKGAILVRTGVIGNPDYMTWKDVQNYSAHGVEMVDHTITHPLFTNVTSQGRLVQEIFYAKYALQSHNIKITGYIPPYDSLTVPQAQIVNSNFKWTIVHAVDLQNSQSSIKQCSLVQYCPGQSATHFSQNTPNTIKNMGKPYGYTIPVLQHLGVGVPPGPPLNDFAAVKSQIDYAIQNHTWVIISFHQIDDKKITFHTSPKLFDQILQYVKQKVNSNQLVVVTPSEGLGIH